MRSFLILIATGLFGTWWITSCAHVLPSSGPEKRKETSVEAYGESQTYTEELTGDIIGILESVELAEEAEKSVPLEEQFDIPVALNEKVQFFINYFTGKGRSIFSRWLQRSTQYMDLMKSILRENGLPEDLVYMALIESGFNPHAYSRARAAGPWQFMKATARRYGLRVDFWVDERRDPIKSTIAAAKYLKDLYETFGHWFLAAAGYNAGERRVLRAMRVTGNRDFWYLARTRYLKRETREYVPKLIAAALIAKNPEKYGFKIDPLPPFEFDVVNVEGVVDLAVVSRVCGIRFKQIRRLNPALRRWFTPPDVKVYPLRVPKGKGESCQRALKRVPRKKWVQFKKHRLRRGDTLWELALKYRTSVREIMRLNGLRNPRRIRPGMTIVLPVRKDARPRRIYLGRGRKLYVTTKAPGRKAVFYKVRPGDTLWDISNRFGVSIRDLKRWNRIPRRNLLRPNDTLVIFLRTDREG